VFGEKSPKVTRMDSPWYRKIFSHNPKSDLKSTRARADQGDADAQFALGLKYSTARGDLLDFAQAATWYRKAAEQNHAMAQFNLAVMFAQGQGVPQDAAAADTWLRKAAEGGDPAAQFDLGTRCHRVSVSGLQTGGSEFRIEAYKWLRLAAAQGYKNSDMVFERVILDMTREEVTEGNQRAARFSAGKSAASPGE
jgi:TPR repeat protein